MLQVNPGALHVELSQTIRGITERVAMALHAVDSASEGIPAGLPGVFVQHGVRSPGDVMQGERFGAVRSGTRTWIVGCGLRDSIEAVHHMLDSARQLCAFGTLAPWKEIPVERFNSAMQHPRIWRRAGLPDRVKHLSERFGVRAELESELMSINKLRGCLVHRLGVVDKQDCNRGETLHVTWRRLQPYATNGDSRRPVVGAGLFKAGTTISVNHWEVTERAFDVGKSVDLSAKEFSEMTWTCVGYALHLGSAIGSYLNSKGLPPRST